MVHPLLLPNVLNKVFSYFSPQDLKSLRLVNLDWNHAACISIANSDYVTFFSPEALQSYQEIFKDSQMWPNSSFNFQYKITDLEFDAIVHFLTKYESHVRSLGIPLGMGFFQIGNVLTVLNILRQIEYLGLHFHYFILNGNILEENIQFPELNSLRTVNVEIRNYDTSCESAMHVLCSIFKVSPNLNKISHPQFYIPPTKCRIPSLANIFLTDVIIEDCLSQKCLSKLFYLHYILKLNNENIRLLINRKYPLKLLFMNMWYPDNEELCVTPASLNTLIAQLAPSLEQLGFDFPWGREVAFEFSFQLPMRRLTYLSLNGFQGSLVKLLDKLPCLRNVELSQLDLFEILPASQIHTSYPTVLKLRLDFCTNQLSGSVSRLYRIFPQLQSLNVNHATDDICRMIFRRMATLEYLRLCGDELTDEGLTGIPLESAKENCLMSAPAEKGNGFRCYPFVGGLPRLTQLRLEAYKLTEMTIKHGLIHCSSLQFVSMDTRLEKNDPSTVVTRTFRLSEYGRKPKDGEKEATVFLQQEVEPEEDEDAEAFFRMYETGVSDLMLT